MRTSLLFVGLLGLLSCQSSSNDKKNETLEVVPPKEEEIVLGDTISTQKEDFNLEEFSKKREEKLIKEKQIVAEAEKEKPTKPKVKKVKRLPVITFDQASFDGGEIIEGDIVKHQFKFKNTGKAPLEVTKAVGTCGCTKPSYPFLDIMPGDSAIIGVEYHSVGKNGLQEPEIYVYSNATVERTTLKMKFDVVDKVKSDEINQTDTIQ